MTEFITRNYGNKNFEIIIKTDSKEHYKATENFARGLIDHAKPVPTIEAKPVVHAHWEEHREFYEDEGFEGYYYSCSNCGGTLYGDVESFNFCHCCGAQMDEVVSDNNVGSKTEGVKIPVISMEDVPKIMEEMEK